MYVFLCTVRIAGGAHRGQKEKGQISCDWSYKLWVTMCVLEIEPLCYRKASNAHYRWAIPPAAQISFQVHHSLEFYTVLVIKAAQD